MKEAERLEEQNSGRANWRRWGPYLSERQWGTVREDYSPNGTAWDYLTHDQARSRAYRWGEDGIAGLSDDHQRLCLALVLWNGKDPILKERLFGLTNGEGNHGEDVKELYYYLDATPTHSYLKMLYKYPHRQFPYDWLVKENGRRSKQDPEFELIDTDAFHEERYFDVFVEYGKAAPEDMLIQITVCNRGPEDAPIHILPQLWFRNTWSWGNDSSKPSIQVPSDNAAIAQHRVLGEYMLHTEGTPALLFSENETNVRRLYGMHEAPGYFKDAFHEFLVNGNANAVNPAQKGTKCAVHFPLKVTARSEVKVRLRFAKGLKTQPFADFDEILACRRQESGTSRFTPSLLLWSIRSSPSNSFC